MATLHHTARRVRARLTYANVMSTLAVVLALGTGTAYAAATIGSPEVIDDSLRSIDVKNENLTGNDVKNATLRSSDLSTIARNQLLPRNNWSGGGVSITDTDDSDGLMTVMSNGISDGNHLFVMTGRVANSSGSPVDLTCELTVNNGDEIGSGIDLTVPANSTETVAVTGTRDVFGTSELVFGCVASETAVLRVDGDMSSIEAETLSQQ